MKLHREKAWSPIGRYRSLGWIRRYVLFHGKRHPADLTAADVTAFLTHLATQCNVSGSTQSQAASSLLFLYCSLETILDPLDSG